MEWIKLTKDTMPEPFTLVWIQRKGGSIYLGSREDKPISINEDFSKNCYWHANPPISLLFTEYNKLKFKNHFSDMTVDYWMNIKTPTKYTP